MSSSGQGYTYTQCLVDKGGIYWVYGLGGIEYQGLVLNSWYAAPTTTTKTTIPKTATTTITTTNFKGMLLGFHTIENNLVRFLFS